MRQMTDDNSVLFYVSHKKDRLNLGSDVRKFSFSTINEGTIHKLKEQLRKSFNEIEENSRNMILISDWSNANLANCEIFLPFLESIIRKSKGLNPPGWKRKYRQKGRQRSPFILVNAFDITNLSNESIQRLISLHQRVFLLQENCNTFLLPAISPRLCNMISPKYHVLSQDVLEKIVKDNLKLIVFLLLEKGDKSGYEILRNIASHFHCILSQGTVYPMLYQLEKENKIVKRNGKGRELLYSLTSETRNKLRSEK